MRKSVQKSKKKTINMFIKRIFARVEHETFDYYYSSHLLQSVKSLIGTLVFLLYIVIVNIAAVKTFFCRKNFFSLLRLVERLFSFNLCNVNLVMNVLQ